MKKLLSSLIMLSAIGWASISFCESPAVKAELLKLSKVKGPFIFAVMGDNRSGDRVYKKIIHQMLLRNPLFIVNTGDIIPNHGNREEWKNFWELSKPITVPYFLTPGNHDIDDKESQDVWRDEVDLPGNETYYSFAVGRSLFVILNSCEPKKDMRITGSQLNWLKGVLGHGSYDHKFVFLHHPLFLPPGATNEGSSMDRHPEDRDALHQLFADNRVTAVIAGHEHTFKRMKKDGVAYIITGGGGAPLYGKGSYNNLMVVDVDGKRIGALVIDREGELRDEFVIPWK